MSVDANPRVEVRPLSPQREPSPQSLAFAKNLRRERVERRLSIADVARRAELNKDHLGRIERGLSDVSLSTILRLASALDLDPGALIRESP